MRLVSLLRFIALVVGVVLSLLTFGLAAGATAYRETGVDYGYIIGYSYATTYYFSGFHGVIAFGVLSFLWFTASLVMWFFAKKNVFNAVMVDTIISGILFVIGLGTVGYATAAGGTWYALGQATLAFGWLLTFFLMGFLIFTVVWTLVSHGGSMDTWMRTMWTLDNETTKEVSNGGAPVMMTQQQQPMLNQQPGMGMQQPMQMQSQQGYAVQPTPTGTTTTGEVPTQYTGNTSPGQFVQQAYSAPSPPPQGQTYTVNLAQPGGSQTENRYTVDIAQPGPAGSPANKV